MTKITLPDKGELNQTLTIHLPKPPLRLKEVCAPKSVTVTYAGIEGEGYWKMVDKSKYAVIYRLLLK